MSGAVARVFASSCEVGSGLCVSPEAGLIIVSCDSDMRLYAYDLATGSLVRTIGGEHCGLNLTLGGVCVTPHGSILVTDKFHDVVQEFHLRDGTLTRLIGGFVVKGGTVAG